MSTVRLKQVKKQIPSIDLKTWLVAWSKKQQVTLPQLSKSMGMSKNFLYRKQKAGDMLGSELVIVGNYLEVNPFEPYFQLLHESCRPTKRERELEAQVLALQTKINDLEKENAWLKEVVMGKK